jgi:hypothetical protein
MNTADEILTLLVREKRERWGERERGRKGEGERETETGTETETQMMLLEGWHSHLDSLV